MIKPNSKKSFNFRPKISINLPKKLSKFILFSEHNLYKQKNCANLSLIQIKRNFIASIAYFSMAITSTSANTPLGKVFTATQLRAGLEVKYFPYTSLNVAKSFISAKKQVVLIA